MAVREIITEGNVTLRKHTREVTVFDKKLWTLLDDMKDTLAFADGVGLAAPQIGILRRIFVIDVGDGKGVIEFINPKILSFCGTQTGLEGCLSVPGKHAIVTRPNEVMVKALDRNGVEFEKTMTELGARAVFHENDHLDGILFIDKADKKFNDEELEEYLEKEADKEEKTKK
ncbi:MAG: peptide deformylase [Clostridia bacterium]